MSDKSVAVDSCTEAELALQSYLDGVITTRSASASRRTSPSASTAGAPTASRPGSAST